jgi:hypothetical protein
MQLKKYGFIEQLVSAIQSLLIDYHISFNYDMIMSHQGVSQGLKMSPMLFIIFVNDLLIDL